MSLIFFPSFTKLRKRIALIFWLLLLVSEVVLKLAAQEKRA